MNWFNKTAKNFSDRNVINAKIIYLSGLRKKLDKMQKLIFQSGKMCKDEIMKMVMSDKITSYPSLHQMLMGANDIALDNPWKFAQTCSESMFIIDQLILSLKKERREFSYDKKDKVKKGIGF